jgi:hypothetical protein
MTNIVRKRAVPKYFFDIVDGGTYSRDDEGSELPDVEAAREEALGCLPELARSKLSSGDRRDVIVDVRDETGQVIFTATLSLVARWIKRQGHSDKATGP